MMRSRPQTPFLEPRLSHLALSFFGPKILIFFEKNSKFWGVQKTQKTRKKGFSPLLSILRKIDQPPPKIEAGTPTFGPKNGTTTRKIPPFWAFSRFSTFLTFFGVFSKNLKKTSFLTLFLVKKSRSFSIHFESSSVLYWGHTVPRIILNEDAHDLRSTCAGHIGSPKIPGPIISDFMERVPNLYLDGPVRPLGPRSERSFPNFAHT